MNWPDDFSPSIKKGWQCPVCDGVMSPTHPVCFYCVPKKKFEYTNCVYFGKLIVMDE